MMSVSTEISPTNVEDVFIDEKSSIREDFCNHQCIGSDEQTINEKSATQTQYKLAEVRKRTVE